MDINKSVREAIINNLDLKPSEFEKRFEGENLTKADGIILEIATDAFYKGKEVEDNSFFVPKSNGLNNIPEGYTLGYGTDTVICNCS